MSFKGCSGVGEGRKDKGGGERLCVKVCEKIVCMYVCMYIYIYIYMYVRTYVCMSVCTYVRMYVCMNVCMCMCVTKLRVWWCFFHKIVTCHWRPEKKQDMLTTEILCGIQGCVLNTRSHDVSHSPSSSSTRLWWFFSRRCFPKDLLWQSPLSKRWCALHTSADQSNVLHSFGRSRKFCELFLHALWLVIIPGI